MKKLLLLALLITPLLAAPVQRDWMQAFEDESPTAVLLVHYRSEKGADVRDLDFAFEGICTGVLSVTVTKHLPDGGPGAGQENQIRLGDLPLTGKDPERFSRLLDYYKKRRPGQGARPVADHIVFQKVDRGKTTVLAEIDDFSEGREGRTDMLTFDEILQRIRPAKADHRASDDPISPPHPK